MQVRSDAGQSKSFEGYEAEINPEIIQVLLELSKQPKSSCNLNFLILKSKCISPVCIVNMMKEAHKIHVASSQIQPSPSPDSVRPPPAVPLINGLVSLDPLVGET